MSELNALKKLLYGGEHKAKNVKFFPGNDADSTTEDMARQMNMFFADAKERSIDGELSHD